jgi:Na+/melibiose symporter-like transporter
MNTQTALFITGCVTMLLLVSLLLLQAAHRKRRATRPAQLPTLRRPLRLRLQLLQQLACLSKKLLLH